LKRLQRRRYRLIDDVEQEMSWFSSVDHSAREPGVPRRAVPNSRRFESPTTYKRSGAKVGRNDPCPCGSGKKFKKCCGK
jgi:preprotein translocase subunit SecA